MLRYGPFKQDNIGRSGRTTLLSSPSRLTCYSSSVFSSFADDTALHFSIMLASPEYELAVVNQLVRLLNFT